MCEMPYGSASSKRSDAAALEEPAVATWTAWDSCRCGLDADGTFWIAPALGQKEGTAKGEKRGTSVFTWFTRGIGHTQNRVHAVRVLGAVHLIGRAETLFWNFDSCVSMDLAGLDVSKVEDMSSMFEGCSSLERLDLSGWDTSRVEDMSSMFKDCGSLSTLNLTGWTVPKLRNLHETFCNCSSLLALDVSCWDTSKVTDLSHTFFRLLVPLLARSFRLGHVEGGGSGLHALWLLESAGAAAWSCVLLSTLRVLLWLSHAAVEPSQSAHDAPVQRQLGEGGRLLRVGCT